MDNSTKATSSVDYYQASTYRLEASVGYHIHRLGQQLSRELDRRMGALELTDAQWKPLLMLQQGVCSTAADIARLASLDTGAVTRLLDRLEAKGFIQRSRSLTDRRVINLELTPTGRQIADQVPDIISQIGNQLLHGFTPAEFSLFKDLLIRASQNLNTPTDAS